jgi:hypothetical protein
MSPFLALGFDGLTTARITIALSGALLLFFSWFFMQRFGISRKTGFIVLLIFALLISYWSVLNIGADLPFAALLLLYMYFVTDSGILNRKKVSFLCGVAGGFSYLAHHYAFPFFIVHYPASVFLRKYINKYSLYECFKTLIVGFVGFFIICSLWLIPVAIKYGDFVISAKGGSTYSSVGPKSSGGHPFFKGGLYKPRDAYALHVFEDISDVKFQTWFPFENRQYFLHQIKLMKMNINYIFNHFIRSSPFFTYPLITIIIGIMPIYLLIKKNESEEKFLYSWIVFTFLIYCSGFVLILARSPRRFYALMIIFIILSFNIFERLIELLNERFLEKPWNLGRKRLLAIYFMLILVPGFSLKPAITLMKSFKNLITIEYINPYKDIADQITKVDFPEPVAFIRSAQKGYTDLYIAYYLNKQLLGRPHSKDIEGITEELMNAGGRTLIVFDNLDIVEQLKSDPRYKHLATIDLKRDERYWSFPDIERDQISAWDKEVNVFVLTISRNSAGTEDKP